MSSHLPPLHRWTTPQLTRLGAKAARMPDRTSNGEGQSGKAGKIYASL